MLSPQFGDTSKVGGAKSCYLGALVWPEYTSDFAGTVAWPDDGQKKAKCEIRVTGVSWKLVESELPNTLNPQRGTPRRYAVALEGEVAEAEVSMRWSAVMGKPRYD